MKTQAEVSGLNNDLDVVFYQYCLEQKTLKLGFALIDQIHVDM